MNKHALFSSMTVAGLLLFASCGGGAGHDDGKMAEHMAMMKADSTQKALITTREEGARTVLGMFESGNSEGLEKYVAENMVEHTPPPGMNPQGIQGLRDMIAMHHAGFPDTKMTIHSITHGGDMMMVHYNMKGTNTGDMGPDMKATGKTMDIDGIDVIKFDGDKATDHWGYWEEMKMMIQLGMMPDPAAAPQKK